MAIFIPFGKRRELVTWTAETRAFFMQIADEVDNQPDVRVGLQRTGRLTVRPQIYVRRRLAVAGFDDGIAVRLNDGDKDRALQIFACRELGRRDPLPVRRMVSMPWSTHERWREFIQAAVNDARNRA